jgi:hypothetical protein
MNNKYPRGKLNNDDEGALLIRITAEDKTIIIDFGKTIKWIGLNKDDAIQFANCIINKANEIKGE